MPKPLNESPNCLNCGTSLGGGRYCGNCGQEHVARLYSTREMMRHLAEDAFSLDSKLLRSLGPLWIRPGSLTQEYISGRRQNFVRPLRLYLLASVAFFAAFAFRYDPRDIDAGGDSETAPADSLSLLQADEALRQAEGPLREAGIDPEKLRKTADGKYEFDFNENAKGSVNLNGLSSLGFLPIIGPKLVEREAELNQLEPIEFVRLLLAELMRHAPRIIFLIVPLVALNLKLLYVRRKRFYMEHFVFALHWHTLIFLILLFILFNPYTPIDIALVVLAPIHLLFAMRRVYAQGWVRTIFKQQMLLWGYVLNITLIAIPLALLSLLTI